MNSASVQFASASSAQSLWYYQPMVPTAVAFATGVVLDRKFSTSISAWLISCAVALIVWLALWVIERRQLRSGSIRVPITVASAILLLAVASLGGSWHHAYWHIYPIDDIGHWCDRQSRPVRIRGRLVEEPLLVPARARDPLRAMPEQSRTICQLRVHQLEIRDGWVSASGHAELTIDGELATCHAGQQVEVLGKIVAPPHAMNPGEFDYADFLRGRRIRALVHCDEADAVQPFGDDNRASQSHWLERLAGWCEQRLMARLPAGQGAVAVALLLGRYELLESDVTERYMRTGTMHILAISGQHLAVLASFLWFVLRFVPIPRKCGAVLLGTAVLGYSVLTGARPPVLRAAVLVCVLVGAILLDTRSRRANPLALALIVVLAMNPSDLFDRGLQLSFLAVAALSWIVDPVRQWLHREPDPLDVLITQLRPWWDRALRSFARSIGSAFVLSGVVWLANVPLLAARFHLFSPVVVPLTVILAPASTIALIAGLGMLVFDPWFPSLASLLARICGGGVGVMDWCVEVGARLPLGYWYVPGPPDWWVAGFYLGVVWVLLFRPTGAARWRYAALAIGWSALALAAPTFRRPIDHLRCQVLAVGNGSAAILHLPSGRTVLVDAGQIAGPRVGARLIAPALWESGISRIDAVFLSHADVDHFNGLPQLAERFPIGAVYVPPHFAHAKQEAARLVCEELGRRNVPIRVCFADDRFDFGGGVSAQVLHPPAEFGGSDNEQSLTLLVEYRGQRLLLTGDLEGAGLKRVISSNPTPVDVLIAPHHGSRRANPPQLVAWCQPQLVVVSQGRPRSGATLDVYRNAGIAIMSTNDCGAITIDLDGQELRARGLVH